jgi:tetratricopeptide (TPR) repeat protein
MRPPIPLFCVLLYAAPAMAQDHHRHAPGGQVGTVAFETSCAPAVQERFERAVAMLHSFWFDAAEAEFSAVAAGDPTCGMAHWGLALTRWGNPFTWQLPPRPNFERGAEAARRAVALTASATAREQRFARSVLALYDGAADLDGHARLAAHARAMRDVAAHHADDPEAVTFLARALIATAPASDMEFRQQLEAAALLEPLFARYPDHPGLAHYIIHAYDAPPIAARGLAAARRYAEIAPAAPHALHMPSHIFTRLGLWDESIEMNLRSAAAEPVPSAAVHPFDYLVYAYLQQGRDADARAIVEQAVQLADRFYGGLPGYNFAAMPARYALERSAWAEAARVPLAPAGAPFVAAIPHFARGIGLARSGSAEAARAELAALQQLRAQLHAAGDPYWPTIVEAQALAVSSWIALAHGRSDEALRTALQAAAVEETVEKHPVTPGPLLPARELYADMLMQLGRHAAAQREYEQTLQREPRRARSTFGAARAAELSGNSAAARAHYTLLLEIMERGDASRPEIAAARRFLASDR